MPAAGLAAVLAVLLSWHAARPARGVWHAGYDPKNASEPRADGSPPGGAPEPECRQRAAWSRWRMDVALHHRAVEARLPAVSHQSPVDPLPGCWRYPLAVIGNSRFLEAFTANADAAKPAQRVRIRQVEGRKLAAEPEHLLDHGRSQDLLGTHSVGAGVAQSPAPAKVSMDPVHHGSIGVQNPADALQLSGLRMIDCRVHPWKLFFAFFAHFVAAPFSTLIVLSIGWTRSLCYLKRSKPATTCAFLFNSESCSRGWTQIIVGP